MSIRGLSEYFALKYAQIIVDDSPKTVLLREQLTKTVNDFRMRKDVNDWSVTLSENIQWDAFNKMLNAFIDNIQILGKNEITQKTLQLIKASKDLIVYIGNSSLFGSGRSGIIKSKELEKVMHDLGHNLVKDIKGANTWNYNPYFANPMGKAPTQTSDVSLERGDKNLRKRWDEEDIAKEYDLKNQYSKEKDPKAERSEFIERALNKKLKNDAREEHTPIVYKHDVKRKYAAFLKAKLRLLHLGITDKIITEAFEKIWPKLQEMGAAPNMGIQGPQYTAWFEKIWQNQQYDFKV